MQFNDIKGQKKIKSRLISTVVDSRISHAQLFSGNEGSGHFLLALAYTQYILCKKPSKTDSCGVCPSCKKMNLLGHPDVHFSFPIHLSQTKKITTSDDLLSEFRDMLFQNYYIGRSEWSQLLGNENKQGIIGTKESQSIIQKLSLKAYEGEYKVLIMWLPETMNDHSSNKLLKVIEEPPEN